MRPASIQRRLRHVVLQTSGAVLLLTGTAFLAYEWVTIRGALVRRASVLARITAENTTAALAFRNEEDARSLLTALTIDPRIIAGVLFDAEGRIFASHPDPLPEGTPRRAPSPGSSFEGRGLVITVPVAQEGRTLGMLVVHADASALSDRLLWLVTIAAVVMGIALLAGVAWSTRLQKTITGPILELAGVARAITERKDYGVRAPPARPDEIGELTTAFNQMLFEIQQQDAALRASEERFREIAESLPQLVWTCQADGACDFLSRQWIEYTGIPAQQQLGSGWLEQIHPDDRDRLMEAWRACVRDGSTFQAEFRVRRHDGVYRWFDTRAVPLRDREGRIAKWFGTNTDVDDQRRMRERLAESEERYRLLVEQSPEVISIIVDGRIEFINPAGCKLYGARSPEDLIGLSPLDLVHPDSRDFLTERNRRLAEGKRNPPAELKIRTLDGRTVYVESTAIPFVYRGRVAWHGVSRDITARKQADEALRLANENLERKVAERTEELRAAKERAEAADRVKSDFLAAMSHELRTPLNAIIGFTGTLLMKLPGPLNEAQEKQLRTVQTSARHLLSLINDLLDVVKIESGRVELHLETVECGEVLEEVAATVRHAAEQKQLSLTVHRPAAPLHLRTDRRALSQILLNFATNAIKFTDTGSVDLSLENGERVWFHVTDTGMGIRREDQARLFEAFTQLGTSSRRRAEGTGLGLHLSHKLASLLGGRVLVESEVGRGSRFSLELPHA